MSKTVLFFHPHTARGGTEQNIIKISKGLKENGYVIHFCAFENNGNLYEELNSFADSLTIISNLSLSPVKCWFKYKSLIKRIKPDYILNFGLRVDLFARIATSKRGLKLISNIRSTDNWRKWYHTTLDRLTQSKIDFWISNSIAGQKVFSDRERINPKKIKIVYNFIENIPKICHHYKNENCSFLKIGVLANIRPAKGHDILIKVALRLKFLGIAVKFIIAGKDLMNGAFKNLIQANNLEDYFELKGFVGNTKNFLREIDISLLPSRWEGMPTSVLEAMAEGIPVIATRVGGVPEIIEDGVDGFIVDIDNSLNMVDVILKLKNEENRKRIGTKGKLKIKKKFSKEIIMTQWLEILS